MNAIQKLTATLDLPEGHYAKAEAKKAVDEEYALAREYEKTVSSALRKRKDLKAYYSNVSTAKAIADAVCGYWAFPKVKRIVLNSQEVDPSASAHYLKREIHFNGMGFGLVTLLHELAHHFANMDKNHCGHGKEFVMYEEMVAETFFKLF